MALQNNLPGSIDVLNQRTGDVVIEYAKNADRVVNLTETSVVRIHASPDSVNYYEREGSDLIVHMKDGTTARYKSFFTLDSDGLHSELIFDDHGIHHAVFPYSAEAGPVAAETIVPAYSDVAALGSLIGASGITALGVLGGIAAVAGIAGIAAAAGGGGGGGKGGGNNGGGDNGGGDNGGGEQPATPTLSVASIGTDNVINLAESNVAQLLSGSTEAAFAGSTISVTHNGETWTTTVADDGSWELWLQPDTLHSFSQGSHSLKFVITTKQGTTASKDDTITFRTIPPEMELTDFSPGNIIDQDQRDADKIVRGYVKQEEAGSTMYVTLNDKTYIALVGANGQWQLTIPAADMMQLLDGQTYNIHYRVVDAAGNVTEEDRSFTTNFSMPDLTVDPVASDNIINSAEVLVNQTISGQTVNIPAGQLVTITLNGKTYYAEVLGDGSWKYVLPAGDLQALGQGNNTLNVSVSDGAGNVINKPVDINVDTTQPGIAIAIVSTDDYLNVNEAQQSLEVRGVTTVTGAGVTVIVTVNGKDYTAVVDSNGYWSALIPSADLLALSDGPNVITATVTDGTESAQDSHTVNVQIHHLPEPTIDAPFGDGYLNAAEKGQDQVLSGNTGVTSIGQTVTVTVGGKTYKATVDNDGTWKVTVPAGDLQNIPDGLLNITVNANDASGNSTALNQNAIVDTVPPALTVLPLTGDGKLNAAELGNDQTLSGISSVSEQGQTVTVTLNGKTYTTTVGSDGNWQLSLPAADLEQLQTGNYPITVTLSDAAGNSQSVTQNIGVKTSGVQISVQALSDGNSLDAAEVKVDQILHGTSNAEPGSVVLVTIGNTTYKGVTDVQGNWQVTLPSGDLQKLSDGSHTFTVSITDGYGQTTTVNSSFDVDKTTDSVAISIVSGDDYLNYTESQSDLTITGNSAGLPAGTIVTLTLNNKTYTATIQSDGSWQATVSAADLAALADGSHTITASATGPTGTVIDSHNFTSVIQDQPTVTLNPVFGDGVVNLVESTQSQTITGSTGVAGAGQTVVATLNGQQFTGTVDANGNWSVTLPQGAMEGLSDGSNTVSVAVTDVAGNAANGSVNFTIDKTPPTLSVTPLNGTDVLNGSNVSNGVTLSGATSTDAASVVVTINGQNYTATVSNGSWSVALGNSVLGALPDGLSSYTVTATDNAGNTTSTIRTVTVDTVAPNVVVNPVGGNNLVDAAELSSGFSLTGKTIPAEPGSTVSITINNTVLTGTVAADGSWSVAVTPDVVSGMTNGNYTLSVTVTDSAGNTSPTISNTFTVDTTTSAIAVNPVESDDKISAADIADGLTINGTSQRIPDGGTITITLNGVQYTTTVNSSGFWQLTVPNADAAAIADGTATMTVSAVDVDGKPLTSEHNFTIITHNLPAPGINAPFGDGVINAAEAASGGSLSGNTGISGGGQVVTIRLDNGSLLTATVDASGNWSLPLTPAQLGALSQGSHTVTITATDVAGNQTTVTAPITVDTIAPTVTVDSVTSDNIINMAEAAGAITISGTGVYDPAHPQTLTVLVNGQNYDAILQPDGTWSITMPAGALAGVADGPVAVKVTITDYAGNSTTQNTNFTLDASAANAPQIQVNKVASDDLVNAQEAQTTLIVSGTTSHVESGQTVTVTLNGKDYTATVGADGSWSVGIPPSDLASVPDGGQVISVQVNDVAGNSVTGTHNVTFVAQPASQPTLTINTVAQDDVINAIEHNQSLDITGSSTHLGSGVVVTVLFNNKTYTASVDSNGNWKITVPRADVQALADSPAGDPYVVTATAVDSAQNPANATHDVAVDTSAPTLVVDLVNSFLGDSRVNIAEASVDQQISGNGTAGETVVLTINGNTVSAVVNDQGKWTMTVPSSILKGLPQGSSQIVFSSTDAEGNTSQQTAGINVKTTGGPTITLNTMFGDNIVSNAEAAAGTTLRGSASGLANGTTVLVTINGQTFTGTVSGNSWSVAIGAGALASSGQFTVSVAAQDAWGNPANVNGNLDVVLTPPTAALNPPLFGSDNILNQAEANAGVQLTGSTGQAGPGQTVKIVLDNLQEFTGVVDVNGNWTVSLTPQQLNAITDGSHSVQVSVTDRAGNTSVSAGTAITVSTDPLPVPQLTEPFTDGILSVAEASGTQIISGQTGLPAGQIGSVMITLNNGTAVAATVNADGSWSLSLDSATLQALPDGVLSVGITVTDVAGNQVTGSSSFEVITHNLPQANFNTPFGDFVINNAEVKGDQQITGNTGVAGAGQTVTITLGTKTYVGVVDDNGDWVATVPQADLAALADNSSLGFSVTVTDRAGNTATTDPSTTPNVTVHTDLPAPTVSNPFGDSIVNISEAASAVTLTGTTGINGAGQYVTVKIDINGAIYNATVDSSGNWSVSLPAGSLQSLSPGQHKITVFAEDQYGNSVSTDFEYQVALTPPAVTITSPVFGDGYVGINEAAAGTVLNGTFSSSFPTGSTVQVTIGDKTFNATVNGTQWTLAMSGSDWNTVTAHGAQSIVVTVTDGAGNSNTATTPVTLLLDAPAVSVTTQFAGDNALNYAESQTNQTIAGTSSNLQTGDTIRVSFNGGTPFTTTVQADGSWSLQLTPAQMATIQAGPITVTGVDKAGNTVTASNAGNLTVDLTPPTYSVNMDLVAGDNYVNAGEFANGSLHLSGHAFNMNGTVLTIVSGSTILGTATVAADGSWTLNIPQASLPDGTYTFTVNSNAHAGVSASQTVVVDTVAPTLTLNAFTSDNIINGAEIGVAQTITGTSDAIGSQVAVTLNGKTYYGQVVAGGSWSVTVPQADMAALGNNSYTINASISDPAGNKTTASESISVDATAPLLQVNTLSLPAVLTTTNAATGLLVQGQGEPGSSVTITIGPLTWNSTVDNNGNWSHTFPQLDLNTLTDGPQVISIVSTDNAGNVSSNSVSLNVALNQGLGVAIDQVFNDGILNVAESLVTQVVTGHINGNYRGAKVSLTVIGANFSIDNLAIGADGSYSFSLPPNIWAGLIANTVQLRVDVVDANGNTTYNTVDVGLALNNLPVVGNVLVAADNFINLAESKVDQTISGTLSNATNVTSVVINFAGQVINATVDALGNWTATLPGAVLGTLPDGSVNVGITVTDKFGNVINSNASFGVVSHNLPGISLDALFGDGVLSIPELANALLSGTATNLAGRTLTIQIGNATAFTTNVDNTGRWSVNLPDAVKALLQGLGTGTESVTITATDQYGNPATQTGSIKVDLVAPIVSNVVAFGDGLLNVADSLIGQTITGVTTNAPLGSTVQVTIGAKVFNGVVAADGTFSIALTPAMLATLADGTFNPQVTITTPDGNTSTSAGAAITVGLKNLPTVAITSLFGNDGYLNHAEAVAAQTISGTVTGLTSGQVTVTIGANSYLATISNGTWSLSLSAGTLAAIADGSLSVTASVKDAVGNVVSGNQVVNAIVQAVPSIGLNTLFGNGILDLGDLLSNPILSGTSSNLAVGTQIAIKVGALSFTTTVGANGTWQLAIPALSLQGLQDGTNVLQVSATATDVAGNVANISQNASVAIQAAPSIAITSLFGDGGLNLADIASAQTISGTSQNAVGSTLTVTIGGKSYNALVAANGGWSITIQPTDLAALADGSQAVTVAVKNAAGNVANLSSAVEVITHNLPTVSLTSLFGNDGYLNISEAASGQVISGKIGGVAAGASVVVTVGGTAINATVDASGNWSATVNKSLLQGLTNGTAKIGVSVTDHVGNTTATSTDVLVKFTQPTLSTTPITNLVGLLAGVLSGLLGSVKLTISGSSTNLDQGSIVHLNLVNLAGATAIVGADGKWSADLTVGLDLAKILSLSTIINLYSADAAGNLAYLNVGLNGSNPTTTPPVTTTSLAAEAASFSLLAASATEGSDSTHSTSDTNTTHAAATTESTSESAAVTDTAYTIGGVSIDLADGTQQSGESVHGGTGNDTIHLSTLGFTAIDGGAGTDTLVLDGVNLVLDLVADASKVHGIEIIDLGKSGTNSVTLDVNEALKITDKPEDDLLIKGVNGDQVNLKHGSADFWEISGHREVNGVQFDVYHNSGQSNTLADVLIQQGLHVNMV